MKKVIYLAIIVFLAACVQNQTEDIEVEVEDKRGQTEDVSTTLGSDDAKKISGKDASGVKVYYFHGRQRCRACVMIQEIAKETVASNFSDNDYVSFVEIDFSKRENEELADKYEVAFSSLIVAKDNEHVNLTNDAFANLGNPDALRELIIKETNSLLNL